MRIIVTGGHRACPYVGTIIDTIPAGTFVYVAAEKRGTGGTRWVSVDDVLALDVGTEPATVTMEVPPSA